MRHTRRHSTQHWNATRTGHPLGKQGAQPQSEMSQSPSFHIPPPTHHASISAAQWDAKMIPTMTPNRPRAEPKISTIRILTKRVPFCASARAHELPVTPTHNLRGGVETVDGVEPRMTANKEKKPQPGRGTKQRIKTDTIRKERLCQQLRSRHSRRLQGIAITPPWENWGILPQPESAVRGGKRRHQGGNEQPQVQARIRGRAGGGRRSRVVRRRASGPR